MNFQTWSQIQNILLRLVLSDGLLICAADSDDVKDYDHDGDGGRTFPGASHMPVWRHSAEERAGKCIYPHLSTSKVIQSRYPYCLSTITFTRFVDSQVIFLDFRSNLKEGKSKQTNVLLPFSFTHPCSHSTTSTHTT